MPSEERDDRWRLNRAGIINVYQYENEAIDFHGGRLLLRGVNGSGKSTAMNMLLPFLVTARQTRIDAAGEQSGVLRSWMLNGRTDAQPVGYLWIEFACGGRYLTCGCGIKANRASDSVTTWWFITDRRPGIDFSLVEGKVPLSGEALRATLDGGGDEVFNERSRRDYRRAVERRLFGGTGIDQHIDLLNVVRNPRIGDRIDVDLPAHIVDALPHLSDQALAEAAQPLDDLETHRRNVDELGRTRAAIAGLLDVYRPYAITQLAAAVDGGRGALADLQRATHRERQGWAAAGEAQQRHGDIVADAERTDAEIKRLGQEIGALHDTDAYRHGQHLDELRSKAADARKLVADADAERSHAASAAATATRQHTDAESIASDDRHQLVSGWSGLIGAAEQLHVTCPATPEIDLSDAAPLRLALQAMTGGFRQRRGDIDDVREHRARVDRAEDQLRKAEGARRAADDRHAAAIAHLGESHQLLAEARATWRADLDAWSSSTGLAVPVTDTEEQRHAAAGELLEQRRAVAERARAVADEQVDQARATRDEAQALVAELEARTEPDMPHAVWQRAEPVRLADLIDFRDHVSDADRAGLEAALEASGLLTARVIDDAVVELAPGELVAVGHGPVDRSLAAYLTVTVADDVDADRGAVERLLGSIVTAEPSDRSAAATVITVGGAFRVGSLSGRHGKESAEFVGVTARRAALERARDEARITLAEHERLLAVRAAGLDEATRRVDALRSASASLPALRPIELARVKVEAAAETEQSAVEAAATAGEAEHAADQLLVAATDELHRVAATLRLPVEATAIKRIAEELAELLGTHRDVGHSLDTAERSHAHLDAAAERERAAVETHERAIATHRRLNDDHRAVQTRLDTIEDSVGAEVAEVLAALATSERDLDDHETRARVLAGERDASAAAAAEAKTKAEQATHQRSVAATACERERAELAEVVAVRGLLDALGTGQPDEDRDGGGPGVVTGLAGADGLTDLVEQIVARLPADMPSPVDAESVRMSLRQRRDAIGAGWDAEARQPVATRPLSIEVHGPTGRGALADQHRVIEARFIETSNLLTRKQDDALRGLLQGLIAQELATKVDEARRLIDLMNARLSEVRTAHDVGVELRWRRSPDLDEPTARLVELLSTVPDLRRPDDDDELRRLLAQRLDEARREHPDQPYRQLIGATLDYRQWHELTVLLHRGGDRPAKLRRSTPLSEGEKKLVTYLPMFAAVAASYDTLEMQSGDGPGPARFLLLDDAFAKVSEDNHAKLFGLVVDLDLDLIATSERLWGTHRTVPEIAITEVIRDAAQGVILLEHYRWDGAVLERVGDG